MPQQLAGSGFHLASLNPSPRRNSTILGYGLYNLVQSDQGMKAILALAGIVLALPGMFVVGWLWDKGDELLGR